MNVAFVLVGARAIGFVARAPGLVRAGVPAPARVGLALALTLAVAPQVRCDRIASPIDFGLALVTETLVGALLGTAASLVYEAAAAAGKLLDDAMGIRVALTSADVGPAGVGRLWQLAFVVALFGFEGYRPIVLGFAQSFQSLGIAAGVPAHVLQRFALEFVADVVRVALELAAPALLASVVVQVALAAVARVVPRFGNVSLGYPAAFAALLIAGCATLSAALPIAGRPPMLELFGR